MDEFAKARWYAVRPAANRKPATYRCPLCGGLLPALLEHMLVLPEADPSRRRHAHAACVMQARREGRLPLREEAEPGGRRSPAPRRGQGKRSRDKSPTAADAPSGAHLAERLRERRERHRLRGLAYRGAFVVGGFLAVAVGILLLTIPPLPGVPLIVLGLGTLALEFGWAERALGRLLQGLSRAKGRLRRIQRCHLLAGAAGVAAAAAVIVLVIA